MGFFTKAVWLVLAIIIVIAVAVSAKKKNKIAKNVFSAVLAVLVIAGVGIGAYSRTAKRVLPADSNIYIPSKTAVNHCNKTAWDGYYEYWFFKLNESENKNALSNVSEGEVWKKLSEEVLDEVSSMCDDETNYEAVLNKNNMSVDYDNAYFAVFDYDSGKALIDGKALVDENIPENFLLVIYDSSSKSEYCIRLS